MILPPHSSHHSALLLSGINLELTDAMRSALENKTRRLFRHEPRIVRVRVDVASTMRGPVRVFIAKGLIEIPGPDLCAAVTHDDAYTAINLLITKLTRMLRKRTTANFRLRSSDDIRLHAKSLINA